MIGIRITDSVAIGACCGGWVWVMACSAPGDSRRVSRVAAAAPAARTAWARAPVEPAVAARAPSTSLRLRRTTCVA